MSSSRKYRHMKKREKARAVEQEGARYSYRDAWNDAVSDDNDNEKRQLLAEGGTVFYGMTSPVRDVFNAVEAELAHEQDIQAYEEEYGEEYEEEVYG